MAGQKQVLLILPLSLFPLPSLPYPRSLTLAPLPSFNLPTMMVGIGRNVFLVILPMLEIGA